MIVIVSDLHIGGSEAPFFNRKGFNHFIQSVLKANESEISHFIMLGDVIDLWWKPVAEVVQESSEIMLELSNLDMKKYYLIGNHDFDVENIYPLEIDFEILEGISSTKSSTGNGIAYDPNLKSGNRDFRFIHGHQISYWHALPFYEIFCKAMCERMNADPISSVWETIITKERVSKNIQTGIHELSNENRARLEYYLAGPLELGPEDEQKSVLEEWELLRRFEEKNRMLEILKKNGIFKEIMDELEDVKNMLEIRDKSLSTTSAYRILEAFTEIWREVLQRMDLISEGKISLDTNEDLILSARRIAAMLNTGLRSNEVLIHGHSHRAYYSKSYKSTDPGHWLGNSGSYLTIDDGKISLESWNA